MSLVCVLLAPAWAPAQPLLSPRLARRVRPIHALVPNTVERLSDISLTDRSTWVSGTDADTAGSDACMLPEAELQSYELDLGSGVE
eukprot:6355812-Prymnesium_polylepis.1